MSDDILFIRARINRFKKYRTLLLADAHALEKTLRTQLDQAGLLASRVLDAEGKRDQALDFIARQAAEIWVDCLHIESAWRFLGMVQQQLAELKQQEDQLGTSIIRTRQAIAEKRNHMDKAIAELNELSKDRQRWHDDREALVIEDTFVAVHAGKFHGR